MGPSKTFPEVAGNLQSPCVLCSPVRIFSTLKKNDNSCLPLRRHLPGILEGHDKVGRQRNAACQRVWVFGGCLTCLAPVWACSLHGEATGAGGALVPPSASRFRKTGSVCSSHRLFCMRMCPFWQLVGDVIHHKLCLVVMAADWNLWLKLINYAKFHRAGSFTFQSRYRQSCLLPGSSIFWNF